jgi:hypothetical protein
VRGKLLLTLALASATAPALAERVETFWHLEPIGPAPAAAAFGAPFLEQRLLPIRLVRLTEPAVVGNRTLPVGTYLYLVFNADRRIAFCTIKDRSPGNQARTLFIPMLDRRPCLADSDGDGRFDRSFSVYDKYGGPPSVRGSINGAQPLASSVGFRDVDPLDFPLDLRMQFEFTGSQTDPAHTRVRVEFTGPVGGVWEERAGTATSAGTMFELGNIRLLLTGLNDGQARFELHTGPEAYISSDNPNNLYWNELPAFVARN